MRLQMIEETNQYNNDLIPSHELANELRELYDLPMISKKEEEEEEENKDLMSSHIIINLNGFLKDYDSISEENPIDDVIKFIRENIS
jgi:hypothetical protein